MDSARNPKSVGTVSTRVPGRSDPAVGKWDAGGTRPCLPSVSNCRINRYGSNFLTVSILAILLSAVIPVPAHPVMSYTGRLSQGGTNFSGTVQMQFVLVEGQTVLWSSGAVPIRGSHSDAPGARKLRINDGLYTVRLGDETAGFPPLERSTFRPTDQVSLQIWLKDETLGWAPVEPDVPINSEGAAAGLDTASAPGSAQVQAVLAELKSMHADIHALSKGLEAHPAGENRAPSPTESEIVTVPVEGAPGLGATNAPIVLVEFTDYQCGFCKQFQLTVLPQLEKQFIAPGKLRLVSCNLPLAFHNQAEPAARAALCALNQSSFWPMRTRLFATSSLSAQTIEQAALASGLDMPTFRLCLADTNQVPELVRDRQSALNARITGTPTFVLGRLTRGKVTGLKIVGVRPFSTFESEINKLLASPAPVLEGKL